MSRLALTAGRLFAPSSDVPKIPRATYKKCLNAPLNIKISTPSYVPHKPVAEEILAVSLPINGFRKPVAKILADASLALFTYCFFIKPFNLGETNACLSSTGTTKAPISGIASLRAEFASMNTLVAEFASWPIFVGSNPNTAFAISFASMSLAIIEPFSCVRALSKLSPFLKNASICFA